MSIHLTDEERASLELRAKARMKPTRRQKAIALLRLAAGTSPAEAAVHAGIPMEQVEALAEAFASGGLAGVGLGANRTLARLVRPGIGVQRYYLSNGATLADLLRRSKATTTNHAVYVDGVVVQESAPLHNGAVVMIVPETRNAALDEPWRATIRSFQDEALFRQYTETLKARHGDLGSDEDPTP
jgi:sulfur carrier protein ThiS